MTHSCTLCSHNGYLFYHDEKQTFYQCEVCKGIYRDPNEYLNISEEKERYKHHKNHIKDQGYIKFANPILSEVKKHFNATHLGLDFGCGHTPVISELLKNEGFEVKIYDPLFFNNKIVLDKKFDFITSCEVIEHFYNPKKEFEFFHKLLKPNGKLICMTYIYDESIDFENWFYKNDPTHVFLYQKETFQWIKNHFEFSGIIIEGRLITFTQ